MWEREQAAGVTVTIVPIGWHDRYMKGTLSDSYRGG
jgi:hypothetical protein